MKKVMIKVMSGTFAVLSGLFLFGGMIIMNGGK